MARRDAIFCRTCRRPDIAVIAQRPPGWRRFRFVLPTADIYAQRRCFTPTAFRRCVPLPMLMLPSMFYAPACLCHFRTADGRGQQLRCGMITRGDRLFPSSLPLLSSLGLKGMPGHG